MTLRATVLVQAADPRPGAAIPLADQIRDLTGIRSSTPTIGAYDTVAEIRGTSPRSLANAVDRIQALDTVARTLTLAHAQEADR